MFRVFTDDVCIAEFRSYDDASNYVWNCVANGLEPRSVEIIRENRGLRFLGALLLLSIVAVLLCGIAALQGAF